MKLPATAHTSRPWRIHDLTSDFRLEDVWALPTPGGPADFPRLVEVMATGDPAEVSPVVRRLFEVRWKLGALFGWDAQRQGTGGRGARVASLRDRLPADLAAGPSGPGFETLPFAPLYLTGDEWAAELANGTMHGVMHLGWVADDTVDGGWRGQMAVLVKPNGWLGDAYMAAIKPFRYQLVYPAMLRHIGREWERRSSGLVHDGR